MARNDNYLTVTEAVDFMNCTKDDINQWVQEGKLAPHKAFPDDIRYKLSMREVNRFYSKQIRLSKS